MKRMSLEDKAELFCLHLNFSIGEALVLIGILLLIPNNPRGNLEAAINMKLFALTGKTVTAKQIDSVVRNVRAVEQAMNEPINVTH